MIVPMARIHVAAPLADRERLIRGLARAGTVHIVPADPLAAVADPELVDRLGAVDHALGLLEAVRPAGRRPELDAAVAVERTRSIHDRVGRNEARLARLRARLERSRVWGDVDPRSLRELEAAGVSVRLFAVPTAAVAEVRGDRVQVLGRVSGRRRLVAVAGRGPRIRVPPGSRRIPPPRRTRSERVAQVESLEARIARDRWRLGRLARLVPELRASRHDLEDATGSSLARTSTLEAGLLCAVQGWIPAAAAPGLKDELARDGVVVAVHWEEAGPEETPPTLIRYPAWARPMRVLFDMLGAVPGYHELDVAGFFMLALPLFAGMIIGDGGYGLMFLALPLLLRPRLTRAVGPGRTSLLAIFGGAALAWGAVTGVWFGITPLELAAAGGATGRLGEALYRLQLVRGTEEQMRDAVVKICFMIGTAHLVAAHLRRALAHAPAAEAWADLGWCLVLLAMLAVVWVLFFGADALAPWLPAAAAGVLVAGVALIVWFSVPRAPPLRRLGLGVAGSLLPLVGAFGDTLSYIRLMAVGLATHYIAASFNTLAASLAEVGTWLAGGPVLLFGHLLNLALVVLAIFAHGVRLNMLEFSSNAGVQWTGYAYRPFVLHSVKEV